MELGKNTSILAFHSVYDEKLALKFDCVIGSDVHHNFPMHIHDSLCIGLICKGKRVFVLPGKLETVNQNEIFIINRNQPHAISRTDPHDYIVINVKGNLYDAVFENVIKSDICLELFLQLFQAIKENNTSNLSIKWGELYKHLISAYKISDCLTNNEVFIQKAYEYIQANYQQQISVSDIATNACMSTFHFCRLFKQLTGLSPHNYLRQYRLSRSYKHLQSNMPVFDTAIETGFYDSSHFIKTFHSYMAVSPKEYQASVTK
jgi:Transcriptional regulator containing an amidase domain and an AraC-type DNA-binding HTH domain